MIGWRISAETPGGVDIPVYRRPRFSRQWHRWRKNHPDRYTHVYPSRPFFDGSHAPVAFLPVDGNRTNRLVQLRANWTEHQLAAMSVPPDNSPTPERFSHSDGIMHYLNDIVATYCAPKRGNVFLR